MADLGALYAEDSTGKSKSSEVFKELGLRIQDIYKGRESEAWAIAQNIAADMLLEFIEGQQEVAQDEMGMFWHNRTFLAANNWFTRAYHAGHNIGFYAFFGAKVDYGAALDTWSGSTRFMVEKYAKIFLDEIEDIYGGFLDDYSSSD